MQLWACSTCCDHHHHNRFTALLPGPPGWAGARTELLDFMVQGKINRSRHTDHPAGHHSIQTNQCPPPSSPHFLQAGCPSCRPTNSVKARCECQTKVCSLLYIVSRQSTRTGSLMVSTCSLRNDDPCDRWNNDAGVRWMSASQVMETAMKRKDEWQWRVMTKHAAESPSRREVGHEVRGKLLQESKRNRFVNCASPFCNHWWHIFQLCVLLLHIYRS